MNQTASALLIFVLAAVTAYAVVESTIAHRRAETVRENVALANELGRGYTVPVVIESYDKESRTVVFNTAARKLGTTARFAARLPDSARAFTLVPRAENGVIVGYSFAPADVSALAASAAAIASVQLMTDGTLEIRSLMFGEALPL